MVGRVNQICQMCGSDIGFIRSDDGFFYCGCCNSQADDIVDTGVDEEHFFSLYSTSCSRVRPANVIAAEPISQVKSSTSQYLDHPDILMDNIEDEMDDEVGPTGPSDFGSSQINIDDDDFYSTIRTRYVTGLQLMIQMQCQALVEKFNVSPLIIGMVGSVWLRYLVSTGIMADESWGEAIHDSEAQTEGEAEEFQPSARSRVELVNIRGKRAVYIWFRYLRSRIPISSSLAISFLVCHVAREAILPSDIFKWALEGKLPYIAAFTEIEKRLSSPSVACPIRASVMFRPIQVTSSQKMESMAADIAQKIGLELPPVNFYAIALRFCRQLSIPTTEIVPVARRICDWSMSPELYLSTNETRIPTRACVMSILIVAIRILFDINGYGMWESSLSGPSCSESCDERNEENESQNGCDEIRNGNRDSSSYNLEPLITESHDLGSRLSVVELLQILEAKYKELNDAPEYTSDLESYLRYCKDVVFAGLEASYEDAEEEKLIKDFWYFYQQHKAAETSKHQEADFPESSSLNGKRCRDDSGIEQKEVKNCFGGTPSEESHQDIAIRRLKVNMEENKFCYIPPRVMVKRKDYLHYARRRKDVYIYAVHADYYILLRSCAKVAQIEARIMHAAVLSLERRLQWLEKRIKSCLHLDPNPNDVCNICSCNESLQDDGDGVMDL